MDGSVTNDTIIGVALGGESVKHFPRWVTIVAAVCAIIFSVVGVAGNLVTVIALLKYTRLRRHATTAFVISLSISDLIFSAVNLPLTASRFLREAWVLGETLCKIFPLLFYGNVAVSLLSMVAITVNRYILISRSEMYAQLYTTKRIIIMLITIWTVSFSILLPPLLGIWGQMGLDTTTFSCTILCIYWRVRKSRKNLEAHGGISRRKTNGFQRREDSRVTRLMLTIFLCFILCFMPLMLANVIDDKIHVPILHVIASILAWASCSAVDWDRYCTRNK